MKNNIIYVCCTIVFILAIVCKVYFNASLNIVLPVIMIAWSILIAISEHFTKKSKIILISMLLLMSVSILVKDL
ncbi:Uncharacterised protein [Macrococcoides caseolyticum]|nr:Uncharacterised protein [Macrococcus caseolyticus]